MVPLSHPKRLFTLVPKEYRFHSLFVVFLGIHARIDNFQALIPIFAFVAAIKYFPSRTARDLRLSSLDVIIKQHLLPELHSSVLYKV